MMHLNGKTLVLYRQEVLLTLQLLFIVFHAEATCDVMTCPYVCKGPPCPAIGDLEHSIDLNDPDSCREVIISTPGYPNGYNGAETCEWTFTTTVDASTVTVIRDFDGEDGDNLILESTRGGDPPVVYYDSDAANNPNSPYRNSRNDRIRVQWGPTLPRGSFRRGVRLQLFFTRSDSGTACSTGDTIDLDSSRPSFAISSPRFPMNPMPSTGECYYTITSPANTQIILEWTRFSVEGYVDFVFIYDLASASGDQLLRIMTIPSSFFSPVRTGTNMLRVVIQDNAGTKSRYFAIVTYEGVSNELCGSGVTSGDACACLEDNPDPYCHVSNTEDLEILSTAEEDLTSPCVSGSTLSYDLRYNAQKSSTIFASSNYYTDNGGSVSCRWHFGAPAGSHMVLRFRGVALDTLDTLIVRYGGNRLPPRGIITYTSMSGDMPFAEGTTVSLVDMQLLIDSNQFRVLYAGDTSSDFSTYNGIQFEVHLLGNGLCSQPCLNGGRCATTCNCNDGYCGQFCEHTLPPDYTCLVKNHYIKPHFAYPVQLYAIAGTNTFANEAFSFEYVGPSRYYNEMIPKLMPPTDMAYGRVQSLPAECDRKDKVTRFGAFSCNFDGDEFIDPFQIITIVNPTSELIEPVGRFTKTVSVGDSDVTLSVTVLSGEEQSIRWRFNDLVQKKWNGMASITIPEIKSEDRGFYEAFVRGGEDNDVVIYRLIVRDCEDDTFGPDCAPCDPCFNGGTCHDVYGTCVCPPAYGGEDCNELLTGSTVSRNTDLSCPGLGIASPGCKEMMLCLPDPGGCMCMPGWTGNGCDEACPPLKFGLECQFSCHCDSDAQCDVATGACPGACAATFSGPNCQQ